MNGFISNYNVQYKQGSIEIQSPDADKRYRQVWFKLDECVMPSGHFEEDQVFLRDGTKVQFELDKIDYNNEFQDRNRRKIFDEKKEGESAEERSFHYEEVEPIIFIKAINVMSEGLDFLEFSQLPSAQKITMSDDDIDTMSSQYGQRSQAMNTKLEIDDGDATLEPLDDDEPLFGDLDDDTEQELK